MAEQHLPVTVADFQANLLAVREKIAAACKQAGRNPQSVRLLPVSKTVPEERLRAAIAAGMTQLAENKVQEVVRKAQNLADTPAHWTVIGHLQTNKARDVAKYASEFQALDSERVAAALNTRLTALDKVLPVYVQVNTSNEENKSGVAPAQLPAFLDQLANYPQLRVQGFMTMAMFSADIAAVRGCFDTLRELRDAAKASHAELIGPGELSMGMSGDYEIAIAAGSTCVRVGQALFGARN